MRSWVLWVILFWGLVLACMIYATKRPETVEPIMVDRYKMFVFDDGEIIMLDSATGQYSQVREPKPPIEFRPPPLPYPHNGPMTVSQ